MRTYHVYRNGLPAGHTVTAAGTPVWGGQPMLPPATTHLEATAAGLVVPIQTLAGQGETGDEE